MLWRVAAKSERQKWSAGIERYVSEEVRKRMDEIFLPGLKQKIKLAQELYGRRRALMTKATFNTIRRALHPDSRHSISDHKLGEAFDEFMALEKFLINEKDSPTDWPNLPDNLAGWEAMKAKARATKKRPAANASAMRPR